MTQETLHGRKNWPELKATPRLLNQLHFGENWVVGIKGKRHNVEVIN